MYICYNVGTMTQKTKYKMVGLRIPENIWKEYKKLCVDLGLSLPKQTSEIIKDFVRIQKINICL